MCYSAMVRRDMEKIAREFGAHVDVDEFVRLYAMREKDLKLKIPYGMDRYFLGKGDAAGRAIEKSIRSYKLLEEAKRLQELDDVEAEIRELESKIKTKRTKTAQEKLDVKFRKRTRLMAKAEEAVEATESNEAYRIYPFYFAPVIKLEKNRRIIVPMRYRILPRTGVEIPTKYNVFNARRDSLQDPKVQAWKPLFGKQHAIFPFTNFYEWVEDKKGAKVEITFNPDGFDGMWAASLYEEYKHPEFGIIRSFAMVTDDPPPEVAAAGHDRCPVFVDRRHFNDWLSPEGRSLKESDLLLNTIEQTYYSHVLAA